MRRSILVLFASALLVACSGEKSEEAAEAEDTSAALTAQDKVSDSEYSKKYGAAMKQAMSKKEE
ncbi:MAG: hypothetical protein OXK72_07115 [Gammaproteobacteria bacterium]|nr:hypothetical protein [Gammaproteobacteria bacterium]MDE0411238.1 hypothetical protein [Gammaproteobacteria bacterium]